VSVIQYRVFGPCASGNHSGCRVQYEDDGIEQRCSCVGCSHTFEEEEDGKVAE
jgi:hypothetical protein